MDKPTMRQANEIQRLIGKHNITRQKLQDLLKSGLLSDLFATTDYSTVDREAVRAALFYKIYRVTVDYSMTLAEMVSAGKYDFASDDITPENFPFERREGVEEIEIRLVHLGREAMTPEVLVQLSGMRLRPVILPELLAFGAAYPNLRGSMWIAAIGSGWRDPDGNLLVPILVERDGQRKLRLRWRGPGYGWGPGYRFATVCS